MFNGTVANNLDTLLDTLSRIAWIVFILFVVVYFIQTLIKQGFIIAVIRLLSYRVLLPLLLTISLSLLSLALVFVQPQEVGVIISLISPGGVRPQPSRAGLRLIIPLIEEVRIYPIYWQTYTMSGKPSEGQELGDDSIRARTRDGQEVRLDCSVIFRINTDQAVLVHIDWQDRYIEDFVRPIVRGFVRTQVSQFTVQEVNSNARRDLEANLDRLLRDEVAENGLILDQFLLRDITFTQEYASSVEQKQVALEGTIQRDYEKQQIITLAEGQAEAIRIEAQAQSEALKLIAASLREHPDLVTYHYVERLSPNIRVMLVPSENPLILPLPPLLDDTMSLTSTLSPTFTTNSTLR